MRRPHGGHGQTIPPEEDTHVQADDGPEHAVDVCLHDPRASDDPTSAIILSVHWSVRIPLFMKTALIVAAIAAVGLYCVMVGLLAWQQRRLLYLPDATHPDLRAAGVPGASVWTVRTRDGLDLLAWWAPPASDAMPVVLYLHGNGGNIAARAHRFAQASRFGWGMLLLQYRGYGGNPGSPTEAGLFEDANAAYAALREHAIPASRIVLWGESLGTGVAVHLALRTEVAAVMLESPYESIEAVAQQRFWFVPVNLLIRDRFDLIGRIARLRVPLLVMTGGRDTVVPPAMGRAVFAAANGPKRFWFAPDAGHNDLIQAGAFDAVHQFVQDHVPPSP
jgi:uncharacterized protein